MSKPLSTCPSCPGASVEYDSTRGGSYCGQCGAVLEESTITSELTFVEGGDGSSRMVGQFVSAEQTGLRSVNLRHRRLMTTQSREETISNARRRIQEISIALKGLNDYHVDRAVQCYKLALIHNFTHGRKQTHVIAACLYTICRQEKTMHMLIDFSDVLHANVYSLGNTFLKLTRLLNIDLPLLDPSLYLSRFASQLEFGDKTHAVTMDALRLVQRMKRDWIHYGRRPAGICGACLLIAARMHGFKRTQAEVIKVVKIGDITLRKRLNEFAETPSAELTIDQFRNTDLSTESNPPSFHRRPTKLNAFKSEHDLKQEIGMEAAAAADLGEEALEIQHELQMALKCDVLQERLMWSQQVQERTWKEQAVSEHVEEWDDLSDSEFNQMFLNEEESKLKTEIWEMMNQDWLDAQEAKRKREAEQGPKEVKVRKPRKQPAKRVAHATPVEATKAVLANKVSTRISKKINYAALDDLFKD